MNKNKVEIAIVLQTGQRAELQLSPRNYKQNFRDFLKKYNIEGEQAIQLKRVIQLSLVEISKMKFQSFVKNDRRIDEIADKQKQLKREVQHHVESPRFKKTQDEQEVDIKFHNKSSHLIDKTKIKQKMNHELSDQEEIILFTPIISVQDIKKIHQKEVINKRQNDQQPLDPQQRLSNQQQNIKYSEQDQQPFPAIPPSKFLNKGKQQHFQKLNFKYPQTPFGSQQAKNIQSSIKQQQSLPTGIKVIQKSLHSQTKRQNVTIKKQNQKQYKKININQSPVFKAKKQQKCLSQDRSTYDRLYYQHTDSFRSKKNQEINRKQLQDQIQVQKYDLNNQLKRTTKEFFYELHKRTTQSWQCRNSKSKQKDQFDQINKQTFTFSTKKVPINKAFKGSFWQPRSRCEAHIQQEKKQLQQKKVKLKQDQIRKRIRQSKSRSKSRQKKEFQHQSRSCQKCSPKKIQVNKRKKNKLPKTQQRHKKNYISQVLKEAYQQRLRQVKALNLL